MKTTNKLSDTETIEALTAKCALLSASLQQAEAKLAHAPIDAVREVFGKHPDDVLAPMRTAADVFDWLDELFTVTRQLAEQDEPRAVFRIATLAALGEYVASDFSECVGYEEEAMADALRAFKETRGAA